MAELSKDELARYSTLAGALTEPVGADTEYRVRYRSLLGLERRHPARTFVITGLCMLLEIAFVVWLLQPSHLPRLDGSTALNVANAFVVFSIAVMELMRMVNVISLSLASLAVRNPVPGARARKSACGVCHDDRAEQGADRRCPPHAAGGARDRLRRHGRRVAARRGG